MSRLASPSIAPAELAQRLFVANGGISEYLPQVAEQLHRSDRTLIFQTTVSSQIKIALGPYRMASAVHNEVEEKTWQQ